MVNKVAFVSFRGAIAPIAPPWIRPWHYMHNGQSIYQTK